MVQWLVSDCGQLNLSSLAMGRDLHSGGLLGLIIAFLGPVVIRTFRSDSDLTIISKLTGVCIKGAQICSFSALFISSLFYAIIFCILTRVIEMSL
mgnify:CR=1 FL=1